MRFFSWFEKALDVRGIATDKSFATVKYFCPVCGYSMDDPAQDYNICACCGTEFGYDDSNETHEELRKIWLEDGARWWSDARNPPDGWDFLQQLREAGIEK